MATITLLLVPTAAIYSCVQLFLSHKLYIEKRKFTTFASPLDISRSVLLSTTDRSQFGLISRVLVTQPLK